MNKTKKGKLKKIAVFCAAVMLALVSVFATLATQKEEIRASAEETTATEERTIYPTDNLFDASVINKNAGVSVSGNSISYDGKSGSNAGDGSAWSFLFFGSFSTLFPLCSVGETYTFSCTVVYSGDIPSGFPCFSISIYGVDFGIDSVFLVQRNVIGYVTCTFTVSEKMLKCPVYAYGCNQGKENLWQDIMLNSGSVAYPYRPVNKVLYDDGKKDGFNQGYQDASDTLNLGVLKGSKISATFTYEKGTKTITDEDPTFTYNGIDLSVYATKYYEYTPGNDSNTLVSADVTITFANPFVYASFPVGFVGNSASDVYGGKFIGTDGKQYACQRDVSSNGSAFKIDEGKYPENLQVKSLVLSFGRASDTLYGVVMVQAGQYQNGYTNGYNDGLSDKVSYNNGYKDGNSTGYANGYSSGYDAGYFAGLSEPGSNGFFNLITTVIDVPITAFSSLLDFSILGVNMKGFVLSLLSFAALIATVRLVMGKNE